MALRTYSVGIFDPFRHRSVGSSWPAYDQEANASLSREPLSFPKPLADRGLNPPDLSEPVLHESRAFGPVIGPVNPGIFRHDSGTTTADRAFYP